MVNFIIILLIYNITFEKLDDLFLKGNNHYWNGEYEKALEVFINIFEKFDQKTASLAYNIGNTYLKLEKLGRAIYYYKLALLLEPDEELENNIKFNLEIARSKILSKLPRDIRSDQLLYGEPRSLFTSFILKFSFFILSLISLMGLTISFICWILFRFFKKFIFKFASLTFLIIFIIFSTFWFFKIKEERTYKFGIIVGEKTIGKESKLATSPIFQIPEGTEVKVLKIENNFLKIELPTGKQGWIDSGEILLFPS